MQEWRYSPKPGRSPDHWRARDYAAVAVLLAVLAIVFIVVVEVLPG